MVLSDPSKIAIISSIFLISSVPLFLTLASTRGALSNPQKWAVGYTYVIF